MAHRARFAAGAPRLWPTHLLGRVRERSYLCDAPQVLAVEVGRPLADDVQPRDAASAVTG